MSINLFLRVLLFAAFVLSCQKEESNPEKLKGTLALNIGLFISVNDVENELKSTLAAEDFMVSIYKSGGEAVHIYDKASDMPETIELEPGQYYVTAHSKNNLPAAFDNPYYYGESIVFGIASGMQQSVTVNCEMANTMITIVYSDQLKSNFYDYTATVSTSAGSLTFDKNETRAGYFQPLPINIEATLTIQKNDGTFENKTLTGSIPDPQPRKNYEIHIDAALTEGSAVFQIIQDNSVDPVEIVYITDGDDPPSTGLFGPGDLLITEIMYDPSILADSEGEWFEIYNNTSSSVDLHQVVIRKNDTEQHIISNELMLEAHGYIVLERDENAVPGESYVYNSAISLNNTGAILSLYNYGTDGTDGSLICSVDYAADEFPSATGASICLSAGLLNPGSALLGNSWCVSTILYNSGDMGTPGVPNGICP